VGGNQNKKPLPVGESFFNRVVEDGYYYEDFLPNDR